MLRTDWLSSMELQDEALLMLFGILQVSVSRMTAIRQMLVHMTLSVLTGLSRSVNIWRSMFLNILLLHYAGNFVYATSSSVAGV